MELTEKQIDEIIDTQINNHENACKEIGYDPTESSKSMLKYLIQILETHSSGAKYSITVEAHGSGDSGEISELDVNIDAKEITYYECEREKVKYERDQKLLDSYKDINRFYLSTGWRKLKLGRKVTKRAQEAVEDLCYQIVDLSGVDWYNDNGGSWAVSIDSEQGVSYSINQNYIESEVIEFYSTEDFT